MADNLASAAPPGEGLKVLPGLLEKSRQEKVLEAVREIVAAAPLYQPVMPRTGKPFSVRMTCAGALGWVSSKDGGYRYQAVHTETRAPWPQIPEVILKIWQEVADFPKEPDCCLVNYYADSSARMGLHQDRDEKDFTAPVLSISLGDTARFRIGGPERRGPTRSFKLASGDVLLLAGRSRLAFHGIDRVYPGSSSLLPSGGRINLTLRVTS